MDISGLFFVICLCIITVACYLYLFFNYRRYSKSMDNFDKKVENMFSTNYFNPTKLDINTPKSEKNKTDSPKPTSIPKIYLKINRNFTGEIIPNPTSVKKNLNIELVDANAEISPDATLQNFAKELEDIKKEISPKPNLSPAKDIV